MRARPIQSDKKDDVPNEFVGLRFSPELLARLDRYVDLFNEEQGLELSRTDVIRKIVKNFLDEFEAKTPPKKSSGK